MSKQPEKKQLKTNREVKKALDTIFKQKKELEQLCIDVGKIAGDQSVLSKLASAKPVGKFKTTAYKVLSKLPESLGGSYFQEAYEDSVHYDPLNKMESNFRAYLNTVSNSISLLNETIKAQKERKDDLEEAIAKAEEENWDANKLRAELNERTYLGLDSDLQEFFEFTTEDLSEEEKERKREMMLNSLKSAYNACEATCKMLFTYAAIGRETYDYALTQYAGFMEIKEPLTMQIQCAYDFGTMDELAMQAPDALRQLAEKCTETTKTGLQALQKMRNHLVASPETVECFEKCTQELQTAVEQVNKGEQIEVSKNKNAKIKNKL